jgi:hypothetical protein
MVKSAFSILAVAAIGGFALAPAAASAATASPAVLAHSSSPSPGDPNTTVTFTVTVGALSMTAPDTAVLGSGAPGTTITGSVGTVVVTDDRALLGATWTASASATAWTTGGGTGPETIPATDVGYDPGGITTTPNDGLATGTPITLAGTPASVVTAATNGDNTATWVPTLAVAVPVTAVGGIYAGTLTQSVS